MLADEIKKELFKKLGEWIMLWQKIENFEKQSGLSGDELIDQSNGEYVELLNKSSVISNEISKRLVHTKYFPILLGLNKYIVGEKGKVTQKEIVGLLVKHITIKEKDIEALLDDIFDNKKGDMIRRVQKIAPLISDIYLDTNIDGLFREIKGCYVSGYFKASCALCRTIAEAVAKKHIKDKGYGHLLKDGDDQVGKMSIPDILRNKVSLSTDILGIYSKIIGKADIILHNKDEKTGEEDALNSIELLHSLFEKFPRTL
jgi:hypothetical protein